MKQVLQDRSGATVVRDLPSPPCPPGGVLVNNRFSVISSGTERARVELARKSLVGKARERPDLVAQVVEHARRDGIGATRQAVKRQLSRETAVGYSSAGVVLEVGQRVTGIAPGDRVACAGADATHAEVVAVPRNLVAVVPDGVALDTAALSTIASIALHGVRLAEARLGDRVVVIGCGLVGQIACRLLQAAGTEVFAFDVDGDRVEAARRGGADHAALAANATSVIERASSGAGADSVLITASAPNNAPLRLATAVARDRGTVVVVGDVRIESPRAPLYDKELLVRVSRSYGPGRYDGEYEERGLDYPIGYVRWTEQRNMQCVLDLQARGRLNLRDLIEEVVPVEDAAGAYERLVGPPEQRPDGAIVLGYPEATAEPQGDSNVAGPAETLQRRSGSGPLRVGLIGPGGFATRVIIPAFTQAGARLEAVGGGAGPSAEVAVRELGFDRAVDGEQAVIDDPAVEAVAICARHETHARLAAAALRAGRHVFSEKPLALSPEELEDVLGAARVAPGVLAVGFNRRFAPLMRELRDFVKDQSALTAHYRVSAGDLSQDHWLHDLVEGGGRMIGEGCHFVDSLVYIVGSPVVGVHAVGHGAPGAPVAAQDNLLVTLTFADRSIGSLVYVAHGSGRVAKERLEVFAGSRTAVLDDYRSLELYDGRRRDKRGGRRQDKGHRDEVGAFIQGARAGKAPVSLDEIRNVHLATFAAVESLRTGRPVAVPRA